MREPNDEPDRGAQDAAHGAPFARLHGVTKRFGPTVALTGVSADVERGDVIGVLGKNGAGKTTLLEVLLGFSPPSAGEARVFGEPSIELSESSKARIGFVPQQDELIGMLSGKQQIGITAAFHRNWDRPFVDRLTAEWEVPLDRRIQSLSVGERQKLSVLLALGHHPELLVLDEPVASLDPVARRLFLKQLLDLSESANRAVVFSSHIVSDLERAANKVWILKNGRMHWQGNLDALKESVVRLHVRAREGLPATFSLPQALAVHVEGARASAVVAGWDDSVRESLARGLNAAIEVEPLGLEEIFIELHR
jgi:ABC-2 type transport system ATP-binding protein